MQAVTLAVDVETGLAATCATLRHGAHRVCGGRVGGRGVPRDGVRAARVVAVGDDATSVQSGSASVTVEVSPEEADAVREAQFAGRVSLVLVAADDAFEEVGADGQDD
ncbi:MAG: hypothetical protein ACLR3C_04160 [Eggerthella lenta]